MLQAFNGLTRTLLKPSTCYQNILQRSIFLLTEFNCVDNSELGQTAKRYKKPYLIGFYRKRRTADIGDVIRVAVKGRTCKAIVVNTRKRKEDMLPRYDNNNIVLVDDNLAPLGTRIRGPMPTILRRHKDRYPKVVSQIKDFVWNTKSLFLCLLEIRLNVLKDYERNWKFLVSIQTLWSFFQNLTGRILQDFSPRRLCI